MSTSTTRMPCPTYGLLPLPLPLLLPGARTGGEEVDEPAVCVWGCGVGAVAGRWDTTSQGQSGREVPPQQHKPTVNM
jgi:hypothetical protein